MTRWTMLLALSVGIGSPLAAQDSAAVAAQTPTATLTLDEALHEAKANSPTLRQTLNDLGAARWSVRNAYGNFLPQVSASAGMGYTGSGQSTLGGVFFSQGSQAYYTSDYSLDLQWQLSGRTLKAPAQAKAQQRATERDIESAQSQLDYSVTTQYLQALQSAAQVQVARQQVQRNQDFLRLAQAKYQVGQSTQIDVRKAEVDLGTAQVQLLRAQQTDNEAKLELLRRMGVVAPVSVERLVLTDTFPVTEPKYDLDQLLTSASDRNPELLALKARENAAGAAVTAAKSEYLPTLSLNAGWSGFTRQFADQNQYLTGSLQSVQGQYQSCLDEAAIRANAGLAPATDCNAFAASSGFNPATGTFTDAGRQALINSNSVFPFSYTKQPFRATLSVSLPIFTGFGRQLRVSQARAQQQDAEESVRARALQVRTDVQSRWLALQTSYRAIAVQQASRESAREQLRLAQDRYRLGSGTSLELSDAQAAVARAEGDYINAVYDYHKALAALEAAVGHSLR